MSPEEAGSIAPEICKTESDADHEASNVDTFLPQSNGFSLQEIDTSGLMCGFGSAT